MNMIKGFVTINAYVNNTPGQISPLGELSTWSRTYSYEKAEYQDNDVPGFKLTTFKSINNTTGLDVMVSQSQAKQILSVVAECIAYTASRIRPYDSLDFKNSLMVAFYLKMGNLNFGDFVDNGTISLPEWISWDSLDHSGSNIKIWLSDQAFQDQYDDYKIVVIPPMEPLDDFFRPYNVALGQMRERDSGILNQQIQTAKAHHPETYIRFIDFDFVNSINLEQRNRSTWAVLVYGKTGDNVDAIKDALVDYVLSNTTRSRAEWEVIFPDMFRRTEFIVLPRWDKKSIPNLTDLAGLYSSLLEPQECIVFAKNAIDFYPQTYIETNITIMPYDYKAVSLVVVNGSSNVEESRSITVLFPDYIPVPSTSSDFSRMQLKTRNWLIFMGHLLMQAEVVDQFSSVPLNMRKQYKGGLLFVSAMYDNVNYLVAARSNPIYVPDVV